MAQKIRGGDRQRLARFSDLNPHDARWKLAGSRCFARYGNRASFDGVLNEHISVRFCPVQSEKECAGMHLPRIASHLANFQGACPSGQSRLDALEHFTQLFSIIQKACLHRVLSLAVSLVRGGILYLLFLAQPNSHPSALLSGAALQSLVPVSRTAL